MSREEVDEMLKEDREDRAEITAIEGENAGREKKEFAHYFYEDLLMKTTLVNLESSKDKKI